MTSKKEDVVSVFKFFKFFKIFKSLIQCWYAIHNNKRNVYQILLNVNKRMPFNSIRDWNEVRFRLNKKCKKWKICIFHFWKLEILHCQQNQQNQQIQQFNNSTKHFNNSTKRQNISTILQNVSTIQQFYKTCQQFNKMQQFNKINKLYKIFRTQIPRICQNDEFA